MPRKTEEQEGPVEVVLSTEDGFVYYELSEEQARAYEDAGRDSMWVLLNAKETRRVKVTPATAEEV